MDSIEQSQTSRLARGDHAAYVEAFAPALDACFSLAVSECRGDVDLAAEVTRDAVMLAWARIASADEPVEFKTWLLAAVRYEGRNRMRKVKKSSTLEMARPSSSEQESSDADLAVVVDTAFFGMTSTQREILDLTLRQDGLAISDIHRVMGTPTPGPLGQESAKEFEAIQEKFTQTVAVAWLFEWGPDCPDRLRDMGRDRGLNPLTRQRLIRHLSGCRECSVAIDVAAQAVTSPGLRLTQAPVQLRDELFAPIPTRSEEPVPAPVTTNAAPVITNAADVTYVGLSVDRIVPLTAWEQARRLDRSRPKYAKDGWPPAKLPGRISLVRGRRR